MILKIFFSIILVTLSTTSWALENITGKVTFLEPTYLPSTIVFSLDAGNATCPAGTYLKWQKSDVENNKAVYSTLLAAMMSRKRIKFHFNDGDTGCVGTHLHLLSDQ
ncbi:hypothetical protein [Aliikangiella maris]|uniref:Uncharacterized protein n=2 Tax=Aliikangiella maris TaxID=3162458 RepID=A0ABV2BYN8_9GAMM